MSDMRNWAIPKFIYGESVTVGPLDGVPARVVDLHFYGQVGSVEYDVRYFHEGREHRVRVFEDELSPTDGAPEAPPKVRTP